MTTQYNNMTPIVNKYTFTTTSNRRLNLTLDPFAFMLNSVAMGDVIASVPVVKYMVDNHYTTPESYVVVAKQAFRPFFPFVPDENFRNFDDKEQINWGIPDGFSIGAINQKPEGRLVRNTPKSMHLTQYASLKFGDRLIPLDKLNYVPLDSVDISHFGVDFTKAVVLVTSYRDSTRAWLADHILATAQWVKDRGLIPVFIGKTDMDLQLANPNLIPKTSLPDTIPFGVDLRNKTSIVELASIMAQAKAVCGVDSGPIHLAGTTTVPIICGYTSVSAEHRVPIRKTGTTYAIEPNIECIGCESRWRSNYWNFEQCFLNDIMCVPQLTAERFIKILDVVC